MFLAPHSQTTTAAAHKHKTPTKTPPTGLMQRPSPMPPRMQLADEAKDTHAVDAPVDNHTLAAPADKALSESQEQAPKAGAEDSDGDDWSSSPVRAVTDVPAPLADAAHVAGPTLGAVSGEPQAAGSPPAPAEASPASTEEVEEEAAAGATSDRSSSPAVSPIRQLRLSSPTPSPQPLALEGAVETSPATTVDQQQDAAPEDAAPQECPAQDVEQESAAMPRQPSAEPDALAMEASWLQRLSCTNDDLGFMAAFRYCQTQRRLVLIPCIYRQLQTSGALKTPRGGTPHGAPTPAPVQSAPGSAPPSTRPSVPRPGRPPLTRLAVVEAGRAPISLGQFVRESVELNGLQARDEAAHPARTATP